MIFLIRLAVILIFFIVPLAALVFIIARTVSGRWVEKWQTKTVIRSFAQSDDGKVLNIQAEMISGEGGISDAEIEMEGRAAYVSFVVESDGGDHQTYIEIDLTPGCDAVYFSDRGSSYLMMLKRT